ncbi:MAG: iron-sulfur cluster assembly accessory protein [Pseudomonadota bacterium]
MIQVTEKAIKQIRRLKEDEEQPNDAYLRVYVKKGGCSGMSYKMDFTTETGEGDKIFESGGERLLVDTTSYLHLIGMILDFEGGLNGQGFVFNNPNAKKTCACGISFGV